MKLYSQTFILFIVLLSTTYAAKAQINPTKAAKSWESNGISTAPAPKSQQNIDLGQGQRMETIAKMEKQEKDFSDLAISGDGRISKSENAVINNIRTLKESIK